MTGRDVREASAEEIEATIDAFAHAARRAIEAGFDGIHGANGYLISEFSSRVTNRRAEQGPIRTRGRALAPCRVQAKETAPGRPGHDLEPVGLAEGDPAQQRLEGLAANGPVTFGGDREDVADQQLSPDGARLRWARAKRT
jgi:hypothetical protein